MDYLQLCDRLLLTVFHICKFMPENQNLSIIRDVWKPKTFDDEFDDAFDINLVEVLHKFILCIYIR